jgi:hypothetical protein
MQEVAEMLEFIVLGEVPGTHIVITYQWALLLALAFAGITLAKSISKKQRSNQQPVDEITL